MSQERKENLKIEIQKRNGEIVPFDGDKIKIAITKAFKSVQKTPDAKKLNDTVESIKQNAKEAQERDEKLSVEDIQDLVEIALIDNMQHQVLKSYILYRNRHQHIRHILENYKKLGFEDEIIDILKSITTEYNSTDYNLENLYHKVLSFHKEGMDANRKLGVLIKATLELTSIEAPKWVYISAKFLNIQVKREISQAISPLNDQSFYGILSHYTKMGLYGDYILKNYTEEEIRKAETFIDESRENLLTYSGLNLLYKRYLLHDYNGNAIETVSQMFLRVALHLAIPERNNRLDFVKNLYDILSTLKVTMATPTMSNSGRPYHQLSSCFIDTVSDSLNGIYKSLDNFAKISKAGGGMGLYFGKVRSNGSDIRGYKGVAGGVIRWIKLANDTAVAVDQLGVRQGSVAVYLDAWHKDLPEFLQLKTNNGDDRSKAHDVFPAICYPNLFWKLAQKNLNEVWHLMCPHEIYQIKGYHLEDFYGQEWEDKYYECVYDPRIEKREIIIKDLVRMIIKSMVETGTPFTFNRDFANEMNPNKHKGVIYSSNLCTEIMQNMSEITDISQEFMEINGETVVVEKSKPGDFVVCNLASLVLGNINVADDEELKQVITTVVRALDNVIDLNYYPVKYAEYTNKSYRAIGLGISGYHHLLAKNDINWESQQHLDFTDELFERINYHAINASKELAKEKGRYEFFQGSDWQTGRYFDDRKYTSDKWQTLKKEVAENGLRNSYLLAVAPTGSTSIIAGTTAGVDPIMNKYFLEEKKGDIVPRVAPDLSVNNFWLYKNAHNIDQHYSIKACGIRQRHIDQSQSFNLYVTTEHTMKEILNMLFAAYENGVKTIYYIRSKSLEVDECVSCSS